MSHAVAAARYGTWMIDPQSATSPNSRKEKVGKRMNDEITVESIRQRIQHIERIQNDDEAAHVLEDELYLSVLTAIAEGKCDNPMQFAQEAIKCCEIDMQRWYSEGTFKPDPNEIWE